MTLKIAIDGPAGSGKTTTAKLVAKRLGILPVDTGAMYRAVSYECLRRNIDVHDEKSVESIIDNINIDQKAIGDEIHTYLNGEDVSDKIRTPEVDKVVSIVSSYKKVRDKLVEIQRKLANTQDVVIEGRDIGTIVLKDADIKIFMKASLKERAKRRFNELRAKGVNVNFEDVLRELKKRDEMDSKRELAPLKIPEGAIIIDTTNKTIEEQVEEIIKIIKEVKNKIHT